MDFAVVQAVAGSIKKSAGSRRGVEILPQSMMTSVLIVAAVLVLFLLLKSIMCKTGTWFGGAC
ncbi:hypothetical protein HYU40_00550 [Candidatus Woesearchaeota archaeon]|nr:hypothetical protein [Candidatus Woesearchaeota archaeon]